MTVYLAGNMASLVLTVVLLSQVHEKTECLTLTIEGNQTSLKVPLGQTSHINFYVNNLNRSTGLRIYVQHKGLEKSSYERRCMLVKSANKECSSDADICSCLRYAGREIAFMLKKTFLENDNGLWMFSVWDHPSACRIVFINVVANSSTTTHGSIQQTTTARTTQQGTRMTSEVPRKQNHLTSSAARLPVTTTGTHHYGINLDHFNTPEYDSNNPVTNFYPTRRRNEKGYESDSSPATHGFTNVVAVAGVVLLSLVVIVTLVLDITLWLNPQIDPFRRCR